MTSSGWIREAWDRVVASDPGLPRLRTAVSAAVSMGSTLGLEYGYARLTHAGAQGVLVAMLLGTVMAMMGSMALAGARAWPKIRTAVFFPVAIGAGMLPGALVAGHSDTMLSVFVVVMFVAVYIRRFGMPYFFYGFMIWMGYFFASFLGATTAQLPTLLADVAVASVWVLLLSLTVLRTNPRRTVGRMQRAFEARARAVARVCADLLGTPADAPQRARLRRRLHSRQLRLAETALVIEGSSAELGAIPAGWSASALRRRLLDAHLAAEELATAAEALALSDGRLAAEAAGIAELLARNDYRSAEQHARALLLLDRVGSERPGHPSDPDGTAGPVELEPDCYAGHLASAALDFTALAGRAQTPPETDGAEEFSPAVTLAFGALPGSAAVAVNVHARGSWNPLRRMPLSTRQAFQVALAGGLAIIVGRELSQARYYWAVIASFVAFAGTATRSETFVKAGNRVAGTLVGLGAGVGLAHLTAGHTLWVLAVIVVAMSCGFYLAPVTYAGMIFFITIVVSQLYSQLNEFSTHLLVLRLEETSIGAAIGIAVALLFLPTSTRDTVNAARARYFTAVSDLLRAISVQLGGGAAPVARPSADAPQPTDEAGQLPVPPLLPQSPSQPGGGADSADLDALTRAVDLRLQQLALVARPLTRSLGRPLIWNNDPRAVRHRITVYSALTRQIRTLALDTRRTPGLVRDPLLSRACAELAEAAAALATAGPLPGQPAPQVGRPLAAAEALLLARRPLDTGGESPGTARPLARLRRLMFELAVRSPTVPVAAEPAAPATATATPTDGTTAAAALPAPRRADRSGTGRPLDAPVQ